MSKSWSGEAELCGALQSLVGREPIPADLIKQAAQVAIKFQNEYKMVVYELEKFIKKGRAEDRLAGMLVIDSVCKATQGKDKDVLCARFSSKMKQIFSFLDDISSSHKAKLDKLVEDWRRKNYFPPSALPTEENNNSDKVSGRLPACISLFSEKPTNFR